MHPQQTADDTCQVVPLICSRGGVPSRGTMAGWRSGSIWTSWRSARPGARLALWQTPLSLQTRLQMDWEPLCLEGLQDTGAWKARHELTMFRHSWPASKAAWPTDWGRSFYPTSLSVTPPWVLQLWGAPYKTDVDLLEGVQRKAGTPLLARQGLGLFSLEKRMFQGDLITTLQYLKGAYKKDV